jgi:hypothetical protein
MNYTNPYINMAYSKMASLQKPKKGRAELIRRDDLESWTGVAQDAEAMDWQRDFQTRQMQQNVTDQSISQGNARGSWSGDQMAASAVPINHNYALAVQNLGNQVTALNNNVFARRFSGGGGGRKPRYPAPPAVQNNPNAVAASPSLNQAVQSGVVPLQAAAAYTGTPRAQIAQKPRSPYDWWRDNH